MKFSLTTLGVSSASPTTDRYPSAHILNICGRLLLIDCGEGCQMLMKRHGISLMRTERIFLSHLHGDHVLGIFGLMSTLSMSGRTEPLHIYAPEGFSRILDFFKVQFLERETYPVVFHPLTASVPEVILEDSVRLRVSLPGAGAGAECPEGGCRVACIVRQRDTGPEGRTGRAEGGRECAAGF